MPASQGPAGGSKGIQGSRISSLSPGPAESTCSFMGGGKQYIRHILGAPAPLTGLALYRSVSPGWLELPPQ